jgi:hypothetical protein
MLGNVEAKEAGDPHGSQHDEGSEKEFRLLKERHGWKEIKKKRGVNNQRQSFGAVKRSRSQMKPSGAEGQ